MTEAVLKATRRRFTADYKQRILREAGACKGSGQIAALLRREGLHWSHLTNWRGQAQAGANAALAPKKRGPTSRQADRRDQRIAELERALTKQTERAERAEALIDVQKKSLCAFQASAAKPGGAELLTTVLEAAPQVGVSAACAALGVARSTYYRERSPVFGPKSRRSSLPHRLCDEGRVASAEHESF